MSRLYEDKHRALQDEFGTRVFPRYDGNGMFLSMGNLDSNPEVGMLFVDFEKPDRRRVQGRATLEREHPLKAAYAGLISAEEYQASQ